MAAQLRDDCRKLAHRKQSDGHIHDQETPTESPVAKAIEAVLNSSKQDSVQH